MEPGFRLLVIDLGASSASTQVVPPSYVEHYLGGVGLVVRLLWDYCPPGADPLGPDNPLVFATGAMAGTLVPTSSKHAVAAKSPLTGFVGDSLSGGPWSLAFRRTGYSAIVVQGMAPTPTYVFIDDDTVHFRPATHLWGRGSYETEQLIRKELGDSAVRVSSIGPAGENKVRYACIGNDGTRQAGRTGLGAVMGSKRLKAIAVRGTRAVQVANHDRLVQVSIDLLKRGQGPATEKYRILGTVGNVLSLNRLGALPTNNFQRSTFPGAEAVSGEYLYQRYFRNTSACPACPIACQHNYRVTEGEYQGTRAQLDYESLFALGPLNGIASLPPILRAAQLCDELGLDTISTGVALAWAAECYQRGVLDEVDRGALHPAFGDYEALLRMLPRIATRSGLGDLLAEGVKRASASVGQGSEHWAMHAKGLELPGYEPRTLKTLALGLATGTRGGCHNRSAAYDVDMSGTVDRFRGEVGRGPLAAETEDLAATLDSLILCKFIRRCFDDLYAESARLFSLTTGLNSDAKELRRAGQRVVNLKKAFNIREGWTHQDDTLPPRLFSDPLPDGVGQGVSLGREELELMIADYYQARGWTAQGLIPEKKLRELGMGDIAAQLREVHDGHRRHNL
ncbi:MAG: aldehyde ferredoxin oxidoreductase family protein [Chloroflexi bacterium]|nr:aldehyde ferredoxin oxidoreductase family protein [Chloroflexota bacterium]